MEVSEILEGGGVVETYFRAMCMAGYKYDLMLV